MAKPLQNSVNEDERTCGKYNMCNIYSIIPSQASPSFSLFHASRFWVKQQNAGNGLQKTFNLQHYTWLLCTMCTSHTIWTWRMNCNWISGKSCSNCAWSWWTWRRKWFCKALNRSSTDERTDGKLTTLFRQCIFTGYGCVGCYGRTWTTVGGVDLIVNQATRSHNRSIPTQGKWTAGQQSDVTWWRRIICTLKTNRY